LRHFDELVAIWPAKEEPDRSRRALASAHGSLELRFLVCKFGSADTEEIHGVRHHPKRSLEIDAGLDLVIRSHETYSPELVQLWTHDPN